MPRATSGPTTHRRHKKVLQLTKGHKATSHIQYRRAHQSMLHALQYATEHRRERKGDMRRLWITRINAGVRVAGLTYSQFVKSLASANIIINRKMLAEMAVKDPASFSQLVVAVTAKS
ncbi:MAG: 50S ribosomal protein L20 [Chloroflexota bacterium]